FDAILKAPRCSLNEGICDSYGLVDGRANIVNGAETNTPNTLAGSVCADGTAGSYHSDESLDRMRLSTVDGSPFGAGKPVKLDVTAWVWSGYSADHLDLYVAPDANTPVWSLLTTITPTAAGKQVMSYTFTQSTGALPAVRANFRYSGSVSPCSGGPYDDRD